MIICNSYEIPVKKWRIFKIAWETNYCLDSTYYCENLQVMISLVQAGYGFAILPDKASVDSGLTFVHLSGYEPISYGIFYKSASKNPLIKKFVSIVQGKNKCLKKRENNYQRSDCLTSPYQKCYTCIIYWKFLRRRNRNG